MKKAMIKRSVIQIKPAEPVTDGDGVKIWRNVSHGAMETYDPFLLLDEISSDEAKDYIGGFPEHPHRGFETVTYMLQGSMLHEDHLGNKGKLVSGSVQWMTAGRGILHSEMPQQQQGTLHGFQLWINLPAAEKMCLPRYREYGPEQIPTSNLGTMGKITVIAGSFIQDNQITTGPIQGVTTNPDFYDIHLNSHSKLDIPIDPGKRVLIYVYQGSLLVNGDKQQEALEPITLSPQHLGMFGDGEIVSLQTEDNSRFLLLAANPIKEPIANWGPFVMNTREEIEQAIADYRNGTLV